MTAQSAFRAVMAERRCFPRGSADHLYRTRAARTLVLIMRGIPASHWSAT